MKSIVSLGIFLLPCMLIGDLSPQCELENRKSSSEVLVIKVQETSSYTETDERLTYKYMEARTEILGVCRSQNGLKKKDIITIKYRKCISSPDCPIGPSSPTELKNNNIYKAYLRSINNNSDTYSPSANASSFQFVKSLEE